MRDYPKAFIFDLDGVITDTSEYHYLAWKQLAEELGITIDREFNEQLKGIGRMESLELILALDAEKRHWTAEERTELATRKNEHYQELIKQLDSSDILPGIEALIAAIREKNIKIALGSASRNAPVVIEKLGLMNDFDYLVDASKVKKGKPDPETFTTAADYLNIPYKDCIGIEDAAAGVEAIKGANMFAVGVGEVEHLARADYVVEYTSQLNFTEITQRFSDWKLTIGG